MKHLVSLLIIMINLCIYHDAFSQAQPTWIEGYWKRPDGLTVKIEDVNKWERGGHGIDWVKATRAFD